MFTSYLYLFYADYYAFAARAGLERAISVFPGIAVADSVDTTTIPNLVNAAGAVSDFTRALDLSYEYLWNDGQNISPIRVSFEALADYVAFETGLNIDDYLDDANLQVKSTYASISDLTGRTLSPWNSNEVGISAVPGSINSVPQTPFGVTAPNVLASFALIGEYTSIACLTDPVDWFEAEGDAASTSTTTVNYNSYGKQAVEDNNLDMFIQIDINDGTAIPVTPKNFANPTVRSAYQADVMNRVNLYKPTLVCLAMEIQDYYEVATADFPNFVSLFAETQDLIKAIVPDCIVMVSWRYEKLLGRAAGINTGSPLDENWHLLELFEPYQDVVGISSYPYSVGTTFGDPEDIPDDYYSRIAEHTDKKIVFTELGWSSVPKNTGTEENQEKFIERFITLTEDLNLVHVNWFFNTDMFGSGTLFEGMGLHDSSGEIKAAGHALMRKWGKLKL